MKRQNIKEIICQAKQGKKNCGKIKFSILGPQNLGSRGPGPRGPPGSTPAGHQEVGRCHTRGESQECVTHTPLPIVNKAAHSGFETKRRYHQKSITMVSAD